VLLANLALIVGVWVFTAAEVWYADWARRSGRFRPSILLLAVFLSGVAIVSLSNLIAVAKSKQNATAVPSAVPPVSPTTPKGTLVVPTPKPRAKVVSPTSVRNCPKDGDDPFSECSDAQVGQWAIDEAGQIDRLANNKLVSEGGPDARRFFFNDKFQECCAAQIKGLRSALLKRLGPSGDSSDESSMWIALFPETKYPGIPPHEINAGVATEYARYLRRMGLALKRQEIPRSPTMHLKFALEKLAPGSLGMKTTFAYESAVDLTTPKELDAGYIVVEFDQPMAYMATDFQTSQAVFSDIENKAVVTVMAQAPERVYVLRIADNPFVPEVPIHVFAASNRPISIVGAFWFDQ
jgi:hypothetical protein